MQDLTPEQINEWAQDILDGMTDAQKETFKRQYEKEQKEKERQKLREKKIKMSELFP